MTFLTAHGVSLLNGLAIGALLFMMAAGLSVIFGLVRTLNLAHGSLFLIGAYLGYWLTSTAIPGALWLACAAAAAAGAVCGLLLAVATKRLGTNLDQALLTLGLSFVVADGVSSVWGHDVHSVATPSALAGSVEVLGTAYPVYRLFVIVVGLATVVGLYLLFERTTLGALARAAVSDPGMLGALGVRTRRIILVTFALGAALAGLGGALGGPVLGAYPGQDSEVLILALTVIVIGGLGSIPGAFLGAVVVGELQSLGVDLVPQFASVLVFVAMALVLAVRPQGLLGNASMVYR